MPIIKEMEDQEEYSEKSALVNWVVDKVDQWEDHRESNYDAKWDEYERIAKGIWAAKDKMRDSERSRLVSPATQQAVESTVSELEEATFGKGMWFDVEDDVEDQQKMDMRHYRDLLSEDLELSDVPSEVSKAYLNGAVFGTGIGKVYVKKEIKKIPVTVPDPLTGQPSLHVQEKEVISVGFEAINPREFVIDPSARDVDSALGCAHVINRPRHIIVEKQKSGAYKMVPLGSFPDSEELASEMEEGGSIPAEDRVKIIEYHGKVPRELLDVEGEETDEIAAAIQDSKAQMGTGTPKVEQDSDYVEAIVTIANDSVLLKAVENPFMMKDRSIIAYQHDTVTESFWGRGVVEKGYNPQKALDAELRARIDAMALTTSPMVAMDATRIPRGHKPAVKPGKVWLTNGNPRDTLMPLVIGGVNGYTFHQSGDLERMVQMGTGAMDSAAPLSQNPRNQTASGMSMMNSQFIKRSKRSMANISRQFLKPLIHKALYRYMQFDQERYPAFDPKFKVIATMGIMAREYEQGQLTQLLSIVPPESPVFHTLVEGIFENSSLTNKSELLNALDQAKQMTAQQQQQQQVAQMSMQLQLQQMQLQLQKLQSEVVKNYADAQAATSKADVDRQKVQVEAFTSMHNAASGMQKAKEGTGKK